MRVYDAGAVALEKLGLAAVGENETRFEEAFVRVLLYSWEGLMAWLVDVFSTDGKQRTSNWTSPGVDGPGISP